MLNIIVTFLLYYRRVVVKPEFDKMFRYFAAIPTYPGHRWILLYLLSFFEGQ